MAKSKKVSNDLPQEEEKIVAEIQQAQDVEVQVEEVKSENFFKKIGYRFRLLRKRYKFLIIGGVGLLTFLSVFGLLVYFFKVDAYILPSSMKGIVVNADDEPIEGAKVCVKEKCASSDNEGKYELKGLKYGENEVVVSSDGYNARKYIVELNRGDNNKNFSLLLQGYFAFKGRLVAGNNKNAFDSKFFVISGSERYEMEVNADGTFEIQNILVDDSKPRIHSENFKDFVIDLKGTKGDMLDIGDIELIPAGDIVFRPVDWLSQETMKDIVIKDVEGQEINFSILEEIFAVEDVEVGASSVFTINIANYLTKEISVESVKQGNNDLGIIDLVREGKVVYESDRDGNTGIYRANFDGSQEEKITELKQYANYLTYNEKNGLLYFISDYENKKNVDGNPIGLVYTFDVNSKKLTKISKTLYEENKGYVGSVKSFLSGKRAYVDSQYLFDGYHSKVYVGNVDGTGASLFLEANYYITDPILSPNGDYMVISDPDKTYLHNIKTKDVSTIFEEAEGEYGYPRIFSPDSKKLIFVYQKGSGSSDLYVRDFNQAKLIQVTNTARYEESPSFSPDSNSVFYKSTRDGRTNIYNKPITGGEEKQITDTNQVGLYVMQNNLIYYMGEDGMYVIDPEKPVKAQLVTKQGRVINNSYVDWND